MYRTPNDRALAIENAQRYVSELPAHYATYLNGLIQQESNWNPDLESGTGARGIAQFIRGTWQETHQFISRNPDRIPLPPGMTLDMLSDYDTAWRSPLAGTVMALGNALRLEDVALREINRGRARGGLEDASSVLEAFNNDPRQWASVIAVGHKDGAGRIPLFVDDNGQFNPTEAIDFYTPRFQEAQQEAADLRQQAQALEASGATGRNVQQLYERARRLSNSDANGHVFGYADNLASQVGEAFGMGPLPFTNEQTQRMYDLRIPTHTDGNPTVQRFRERLDTGVGVVERAGDVPIAQIQRQRQISRAGTDFAVPDYINIYGQVQTEQPISNEVIPEAPAQPASLQEAEAPALAGQDNVSIDGFELPNRGISFDTATGTATFPAQSQDLPPVNPETLEGLPEFSDPSSTPAVDPNAQFEAAPLLGGTEQPLAANEIFDPNSPLNRAVADQQALRDILELEAQVGVDEQQPNPAFDDTLSQLLTASDAFAANPSEENRAALITARDIHNATPETIAVEPNPITSGPLARGQLGGERLAAQNQLDALANLQQQQADERSVAARGDGSGGVESLADLGDTFSRSQRDIFGFAPGSVGDRFNRRRQALLEDANERALIEATNDSAAIRRSLIPELNIGADREALNAIFPEQEDPLDFGQSRPARENFAPFANDSISIDTPSNASLNAIQGFISEGADGTRQARAQDSTLQALANLDPVAATQIAVDQATLAVDPFLSLDDNASLFEEFQIRQLRPDTLSTQDSNLAQLRNASDRGLLRRDTRALRGILGAIANERRTFLNDEFLFGRNGGDF